MSNLRPQAAESGVQKADGAMDAATAIGGGEDAGAAQAEGTMEGIMGADTGEGELVASS